MACIGIIPAMARRVLAGLLVAACVTPRAGAADTVRAAFLNPPAAARPMLRWWWPGGDVADARLRDQLAEAVRAGFGGFEIQPFRAGLFKTQGAQAARIDSYATPAFFAHVTAAARAAASLGASVDYTLGSGWPSGGGAITPELGMLELRAASVSLAGPMAFHGAVPQAPDAGPSPIDTLLPRPAGQMLPAGWAARLAARRRLVAVLAVRGTAPVLQARPGPPGLFGPPPPDVAQSGALQPGSTIDLTARVAADGTLDWQVPPGAWQLIAFSQAATGQQVALAAGAGAQLVADHFDAAAFAAHVHAVGDAGLAAMAPLAGRGIGAVFVDSFELTPRNYWAADFLSEFRRRRGYGLTPYLPLILLPNWMDPYHPQATRPLYDMGDTGPRVLEDYHRTVSELMQERFVRPLVDWSHAHGFAARLQAHGAPVDLVQTYGMADIPETEDLFTGPFPDFLSYARSAADIYGRHLVSSESFIIDGHALDATPAMFKARADRLFIGGVNRVIAHGMPYPYQDDAGLGWVPFAAMVGNPLGPRNPIFDTLLPWTQYVARLQAVLQATRPVVPVALYADAVFVHSSPDVAAAREGALSAALRAGGYTADTLTRDGLMRSRADRGGVVTPGGQRYAAIVIEAQAALDPGAAARLAAFARTGVKVLFSGQVPARATGLAGAGDDATVRAAVAELRRGGPGVVDAGTVAAALAAAGVAPNIRFSAADRADFIERSDGVRHFVLLANPGHEARHVEFGVPYRGGVQLWHPWTGIIEAAPARAAGAGMALSVTLPAYGSALLVIDPGMPFEAGTAPVRTVAEIETVGGQGWQFQADGFDNHDHRVQVVADHAALADWRTVPELGAFSGHGVYRTTFFLAKAPNGRVLLDLGAVDTVARVTVNGCAADVVMAPYVVDVTRAVRAGANTLVVDVANTPGNGEAGRTIGGFVPGAAPIAAGLRGPVRLLSQGGPRDGDVAACGQRGGNQ